MNRKRIYQYTDPNAEGDDTRWIAADNKEDADNYAHMEAWRDCGGEILAGTIYDSPKALIEAGCDVVLPDGGLEYENRYRHRKCKTSWRDTWSCACNDRCPSCNAEIEPYKSKLIKAPWHAPAGR